MAIIVGCLPGRDELKLFLISRQFGFVQLTDGTGFLLFCKYFPSSYSALSFSVNLMTFLTAPQFVSRQPYCFDAYKYCLQFPLCFLYIKSACTFGSRNQRVYEIALYHFCTLKISIFFTMMSRSCQ